jgi:hypothetical protein
MKRQKRCIVLFNNPIDVKIKRNMTPDIAYYWQCLHNIAERGKLND